MTGSGPSRRVLAFDTTGALGSAALVDVGGTGSDGRGTEIVECFSPARRHAASLLPAVRRILDREGAGVAPRERDAPFAGAGLSLVAATRGPGSFTGLRVGLATLHGLALALDLPAVGVSSLEAAALADVRSRPGSGRRLALVDALRGEVFAEAFADGEPGGDAPGSSLGPPTVLDPAAAVPLACRLGVRRICGPGALRYRNQIAAALANRQEAGIELGVEPLPLAPAAARLAARRAADDPDTLPATLRPLYLREPDIHGAHPASLLPGPASIT